MKSSTACVKGFLVLSIYIIIIDAPVFVGRLLQGSSASTAIRCKSSLEIKSKPNADVSSAPFLFYPGSQFQVAEQYPSLKTIWVATLTPSLPSFRSILFM
jgi:hypothetical protein